MKKYIGIAAISATIILMISLYGIQRKNEVNYCPDWPVYRSSDTTMSALVTNELIQTGKNQAKQQRSMDTSLLMLIVSTIGIFATIIFNPKLAKIEAKIDKVDKENNEQHSVLQNDIRLGKIKDNIELSLSEILIHCLESSPEGIIRFVNFEGEQTLRFAREIMNGKFDHSAIIQARLKIDEYIAEGKDYAESFGKPFEIAFCKLQHETTSALYKGIKEIATDDAFNSKTNRFRILCEVFLYDHLRGIINIYINGNK